MPFVRRSALVLCLGMLTATAPVHASAWAQPAEDALIGLWASETRYGPEVRGELTLVREGSQWRASISGATARFGVTGDEIRFALPGGRGGFRGALAGDGRAIRGFWLKPSGATRDRRDPGGSGQPFASPLVLASAGKGVWKGDVRPLEDRFTLYLSVYRNEEGVLVGAFRNPEMNANGGASRFRVTRTGDAVRFAIRYDETSPEISHAAILLRSPDRLRISWPEAGGVLELVRRTPDQVPRFFPRPPGEPAYDYRAPPALGDGWETARGAAVGIDEAALQRVVRQVIESDPAARRPSLIHSILVARRGKLVLEEYFFGYDRDTPHDIRSGGKTFSSILLGAAMREGAPLSPQSRITEVMARLGPFANPDPRKDRITLAHLMTHTAGLACDDNDEKSPGREDTMWTQDRQPNWWKYTLDLPMAHDPGERYAYCSANINLVGGAIATATRTWLPEYFDRKIARPLQFGPYHWNLSPAGDGYLGGGAFLKPRDLLKVGQLYLDGGVWKGRRVVDAAWVKDSTAPRVEITPATTGLTAEQFGEFYGGGADAYAWHGFSVKSGDRAYEGYQATGNGGQVLIVVPELDLVVVFTGGNYGQGGIWSRWGAETIGGQIIPTLRP